MKKIKTKFRYPVLFLIMLFAIQADKPAYKIFAKDGLPSSYGELLKKASDVDVVLFGELHNSAIAHWLQLELTKDLYELKKEKLVLGAEMFEADEQFKIDEYFQGLISRKSFEKEMRLWNNYQTDYKPLLEFAREKSLGFIATNIPRRYASQVAFKGLDSLKNFDKFSRKFMTPLPVEFDPELPGYKRMSKMGGHGMSFIAEAQAVKDATMAHFILENLKKDMLFIHFNGAYHSNNYEGIYWYLKQDKPKLKILTISTVVQEDIEKFNQNNADIADFIIVVDEDVTNTY